MNAELLSEVKDSERLQTLYLVNDMLNQIAADGLDINIILPRVLKVAVKQLNALDGSIIVVDEQLEVEHAWLANDQYSNKQFTLFLSDIIRNGLAGWVIRNREPSIIHDTLNDSRWLARPDDKYGSESWSVMCTPFVIRNQVIGAITIHKPGISQFDDNDLSLLGAISSLTASTVQNARLYEKSLRQLQVTNLLREASSVINSSLDINEIMQHLLTQMNELLNAEAISIALVDKKTNELVYRTAEGLGSDKIVGLRLPSNQGISGWVMEHGEPVIVNDTSQDSRWFGRFGDKRTGAVTRAMMCAPVQSKGEVWGTIQAINPINGRFIQEDLDLLVNLANIASSAIANAQQFARTQAAQASYQSLFQGSVDPILLTDLDGYIVEANRRAINFFGYTRDSMLGLHISELHPPDTTLPPAKHVRGDSVRVFTSQALPKDRHPIHVEIYAKRTSFGDHDMIQWIHHDISKQVELEEMRRDLTAMLFHDLQSPLGNVIASLELIKFQMPADSDESLLSMLDIAKRSSHHLQSLIRSLLDIDRLEAGSPVRELKLVPVQKLIDDVYEIESPNLERREIIFTSDIAPDIPELRIEEDMIQRVLVNLVDNAIKHSLDNKRITIVARRDDKKENMLFLSVSDEGEGIPKGYRETIFEKFQRVKDDETSSKGLGLGLAFCRLAVEAHGGRIWVDDAPGGGAQFNLTLPTAV
ncbi:MAG: GAF domain-containing protein [Anaerolineales bacterium]|nr:GAF domain-containing protein [Anaerolineales bacterium]